jgi:2-polyprenyl-3-methyl-5-hydroxy-6-metoxy-1,4-benzoquinol methylase
MVSHNPIHLPSPEQAAYLADLSWWADGERMVPEAFVGGIDNVISHFEHWSDMADMLREGERLLEIGCGCGMPSRIYSLRTHCEVVAVDKPEVIAVSSVMYRTPGVTFVGHDFNEPFDLGTFDVVICVDVIEHIVNKDVLLQSLANADNGNTRWLLSVPIGPDKNSWHVTHWATAEDFANDISRFLPMDRVTVI